VVRSAAAAAVRRAEARARSVSVLRGRFHHLRRYGQQHLNCLLCGVRRGAPGGVPAAPWTIPPRLKVFSRVLKISDRRVECAAAVGRWPLSGAEKSAVWLHLQRREILTLGEGFNTQVITLWCFYIVLHATPCRPSAPA